MLVSVAKGKNLQLQSSKVEGHSRLRSMKQVSLTAPRAFNKLTWNMNLQEGAVSKSALLTESLLGLIF